METKELERLLQDLESDRVERKPSPAQSKEIRQTICAFANDLPGHGTPGVLFVGAEDDGTCAELGIDEIFEVHISVAADLTSAAREIRQPDYPIVALQQLARNAVMHRNYEGTNAPVRITWFEDRIEIQNPGGPFGQVSRDNFGQPGVTDYRNPHLAEAMKNLGYVQRFGLGIPMARQELERNSNPPVEFHLEDTHVLAVVRRRT